MLLTFSFLAARRVILGSTESEMPTSGDLKSGDSLFFTTPRKFNEPHLPPAPQPLKMWEWLRRLYEVLHELHTTKIRDHRFNLMPEIIFVSD